MELYKILNKRFSTALFISRYFFNPVNNVVDTIHQAVQSVVESQFKYTLDNTYSCSPFQVPHPHTFTHISRPWSVYHAKMRLIRAEGFVVASRCCTAILLHARNVIAQFTGHQRDEKRLNECRERESEHLRFSS